MKHKMWSRLLSMMLAVMMIASIVPNSAFAEAASEIAASSQVVTEMVEGTEEVTQPEEETPAAEEPVAVEPTAEPAPTEEPVAEPTAEELLQLVDQAMVQQGDFEIATTYYAQTFGDKTGTLYIMDGVVDRSTTNQQIQLFKSLQIPAETWNNEYADAAFDIEVTAYAAQADNLSAEDFETMVLEQAKGLADNFENYGFN